MSTASAVKRTGAAGGSADSGATSPSPVASTHALTKRTTADDVEIMSASS